MNHLSKFDHLLQIAIPVRSLTIRIFVPKPACVDFSPHLARNGNVSLHERLHHRLKEIFEAFWIGFDHTSFLHLFRESFLKDDSVEFKSLLCVFLRIQLLYPAVQLLVDFNYLGSVIALLHLVEHFAQVAVVEQLSVAYLLILFVLEKVADLSEVSVLGFDVGEHIESTDE